MRKFIKTKRYSHIAAKKLLKIVHCPPWMHLVHIFLIQIISSSLPEDDPSVASRNLTLALVVLAIHTSAGWLCRYAKYKLIASSREGSLSLDSWYLDCSAAVFVISPRVGKVGPYEGAVVEPGWVQEYHPGRTVSPLLVMMP
nr:unnamed protein product [Callosobruchus analis]